MGHICPMLANYYAKILSIFLIFLHFNCILLQISHKKCFFINIFIPGRSGVNYGNNQCNLVNMMLLSKK